MRDGRYWSTYKYSRLTRDPIDGGIAPFRRLLYRDLLGGTPNYRNVCVLAIPWALIQLFNPFNPTTSRTSIAGSRGTQSRREWYHLAGWHWNRYRRNAMHIEISTGNVNKMCWLTYSLTIVTRDTIDDGIVPLNWLSLMSLVDDTRMEHESTRSAIRTIAWICVTYKYWSSARDPIDGGMVLLKRLFLIPLLVKFDIPASIFWEKQRARERESERARERESERARERESERARVEKLVIWLTYKYWSSTRDPIEDGIVPFNRLLSRLLYGHSS